MSLDTPLLPYATHQGSELARLTAAVPRFSEKSARTVGECREQWKSTKTGRRSREVWGMGEENREFRKSYRENSYVIVDRRAEHPGG